jgi:hypothetical protein
LTPGDQIVINLISYAIQSNQVDAGFANIVVAPAVVTIAGIQDITFETVVATPISVAEDLAYWSTSNFPLVQGLKGVDIAYANIVPDDNAYGVDLLVQQAYIPDPAEWWLKLVAGGGGSGGGGDFTPTLFTGAGSTGYVPDPITENDWFLRDDGSWVLPTDTNTTDHTLLTSIGTNTHVAIDSHIADSSIHFTEGSISHLNIQDIGTYSHMAIDSHIDDVTTNPHAVKFSQLSDAPTIITDHTALTSIGTNTHAQIDSHISDLTIHFADVGIDGLEYVRKDNTWVVASGGGVTDHTQLTSIGNNTHPQIDDHIQDTFSNPHQVSYDQLQNQPFIPTDHGQLTGLSDDDHSQYLTDSRGDARYPIRDGNFTNMVIASSLPGSPNANTLYFIT